MPKMKTHRVPPSASKRTGSGKIVRCARATSSTSSPRRRPSGSGICVRVIVVIGGRREAPQADCFRISSFAHAGRRGPSLEHLDDLDGLDQEGIEAMPRVKARSRRPQAAQEPHPQAKPRAIMARAVASARHRPRGGREGVASTPIAIASSASAFRVLWIARINAGRARARPVVQPLHDLRSRTRPVSRSIARSSRSSRSTTPGLRRARDAGEGRLNPPPARACVGMSARARPTSRRHSRQARGESPPRQRRPAGPGSRCARPTSASKGSVAGVLRSIGQLSSPRSAAASASAPTRPRQRIEDPGSPSASSALESADIESKPSPGQRLDVSLPGAGRAPPAHCIRSTRVMRDVEDFFRGRGFSIEEGPEVETEYNNFDALNMPAITRPATCRTPSGSRAATCCAPTPRPCRSAR